MYLHMNITLKAFLTMISSIKTMHFACRVNELGYICLVVVLFRARVLHEGSTVGRSVGRCKERR